MPLIFEQPNLDDADENHLYFDPGDGRVITVFTHEGRSPVHDRTPTDPGCVHHIAFDVSLVSLRQAEARLKARGIASTGIRDRGFMDSLYFRDPLGFLIELAAYKFTPPEGVSPAQVLAVAYRLREAAGAAAIEEVHVADAVEELMGQRHPEAGS